jgi:hypothetical protein
VIRFLADEDFNNDVLRALRRRRPAVDVVRVQDVGLSGRPDPAVLAWAAEQGRVLLTHDAATLVGHALARLAAGEAMDGRRARRAAGSVADGGDRRPGVD